MAKNVAQKLIESHLVDGEMTPGKEIALTIDQTLTQDATGTLVMLELEAMQLDRVKTEISAQYVDHNLIQEDNKNPDDHLFLQSACERFGAWFSRPGNGISHAVHMERFGRPGKTLLGSDSHTPAGGSMGMLAIGAGGLEVAMAMAGEPLYTKMPKVFGVKLTGKLPDWVSAKDVILEMLRRHGVSGGAGTIIEYYGPGLDNLEAMDRHVIANMGAELGATTTVFPADAEIKRFLTSQGRGDEYEEWVADPGASYDKHDEIDMSTLVPLIAKPTSPGNVVPVSGVAGGELYQAYIGSSANPGYRDFAMAAEMVAAGRPARRSHSTSIRRRGPCSRPARDNLLAADGGARLHQAGCNGCIGMAGAGAQAQQPAYHAAQLPRPLGHQGGLGVSVLAGDGDRQRPHGRDHRSAYPRFRLSAGIQSGRSGDQRAHARIAAAPRGGAPGRTGQGAQHRLAAGFRRHSG